jgi:NAD(P)-dependent dehydrogenase (short-subunit alcohol dehydrogenase family)
VKIIVIGGKGTIGSAVVKELSPRHEILVAGRQGGNLVCDITSEQSIRQMYIQAGKFDAVVATTGKVHFEDLSKMTAAKYQIGINDKLMGQVNLVLIGSEYIQDQGSFTLTSGVLSHDPIRTGSSASMVNRAIDGFVKGAAIELPRQIRINAVSPTVILESMGIYGPYFRGFDPVPVAKAALAYSKSVEGLQTGQIYHVLH